MGIARSAVAVVLTLAAAACSKDTPTEPTGQGGTPSTTTTTTAAPTVPNGTNHPADIARCAEFNNAYRATVGARALDRSPRLEQFGAAAAESDGRSGVPHAHFRATNGGGGVSSAENMLLRVSVLSFGSIEQVLRTGLAEMWREGPGGGHHDNMRNTRWSEIGCGIFVDNGRVTINVEFR